jgi:hypothetical protein
VRLADRRKVFFFEKKKPKTRGRFGFGVSGESPAQTRKSFLVLFFKKEPLPLPLAFLEARLD